MTAGSQISVMIVEDSLTARTMLKRLVEKDPALRVTVMARDPFDAVEKMRESQPDVMMLDIELPRMDGLTFLRRIMTQSPLPVVICSNHTSSGSEATMKALQIGAVEVLSKSDLGPGGSEDAAMRVSDAIHAASQARVRRSAPPPQLEPRALTPGKKLTADAIMPSRGPNTPTNPRTPGVVGIGASTGGTEALAKVLAKLDPSCPPIAIVQHMPEKFTAAFAKRLDGLCAIEVREAQDGDVMRDGLALIAPGHAHIAVNYRQGVYRVQVIDGPPVSRHKPSVDVLFRSLSISAGANALGVIMTGMGDDGATCMLEMRDAGAKTIAQDEASCVVYGMPREAVERGAIERQVPLDQIAGQIMQFKRNHNRGAAMSGTW
ncbi:protein-glutamate methylesterase/protein-glutamine glutaminase [Pseudoprimorskyibacter insulae]|uniref:Protein-glutamate methylesterase/protein-glutamine glutaminase n=1 Tax=Pseudoprimorskyibacter insulae TaxID=1695997 RepID=A0A2R8ANG0_9RHOB|nr:chemotaxis response regulator protein-glutamate methylesterase [Pseudoprimorskyibacter insulae]SPF77592.1 Chemotaxis response regulator protein-glutamate methylesterase of group 3 operon [Pseudoprimorskyibacter insulae]